MDLDFDLTKLEGFAWDQGNLSHIAKHKVSYLECEQVFANNPLLISKDEAHSETEKRWQVLGQSNGGRQIFLIFTIRKNLIRIVSARNQSRKERIIFKKGGET